MEINFIVLEEANMCQFKELSCKLLMSSYVNHETKKNREWTTVNDYQLIQSYKLLYHPVPIHHTW